MLVRLVVLLILLSSFGCTVSKENGVQAFLISSNRISDEGALRSESENPSWLAFLVLIGGRQSDVIVIPVEFLGYNAASESIKNWLGILLKQYLRQEVPISLLPASIPAENRLLAILDLFLTEGSSPAADKPQESAERREIVLARRRSEALRSHAEYFLRSGIFSAIESFVGSSLSESRIRNILQDFSDGISELSFMGSLIIDIHAVNGYLYEKAFIAQAAVVLSR